MSQVMLIAVDADDTRTVAAAGHQWAQALGMRPVLVHALPDPPSPPSGDERLREEARDPAHELLEVAAAAYPTTERRLIYGSPAHAILDAAAEVDAQVVVVGSSGAGTIRALLTGSVSRELVKEARIPVMVVPSTPTPTGGEGAANLPSRPSVLCGVATPQRPDQCISTAAAISEQAGLRLVLAHVTVPVESFTPKTEREERQGERLEEAVAAAHAASGGDLDVTTQVVSGDPAQELRVMASRTAARLMVVGANGKGALEATFLVSVSQELLGTSPSPVLVVPPGTGLAPNRAHTGYAPAA